MKIKWALQLTNDLGGHVFAIARDKREAKAFAKKCNAKRIVVLVTPIPTLKKTKKEVA